jgi:ribonuclease J
MVVAGPDIISRGFVYVREAEDLMDSVREKASEVLEDCLSNNTLDWASLKSHLKNELGGYIFTKTKRKPMILPVIMDV